MRRCLLTVLALSLAGSASAQSNSKGYDWDEWDECMFYMESEVDCGEEPPGSVTPPPTPPPAPPPTPPPAPEPSQAEQLKSQAWAAYSAKNYDEAIRLAGESIALDATLWESFHFRAWSYYFTGQYDKAAEDHARTVEIGPKTDPYLSFSVAICKSLAGANQQSLEWAGRALGIQPDFSMALTQMGYAYFDLGEPDLAGEKFAAAVASDAKRADAHLGLALVASGKGDAAAAQKHLADAKALASDLDAIDIWMNATRRYTARQKAAIAGLQGTGP